MNVHKQITPEDAQAKGLRSFIARPTGQRISKCNDDAVRYANSQGWRIVGRHDVTTEGRLTRTFYYEAAS